MTSAMKNKTVAILESRAGEQVADLVRKYGGVPLLAPALAEIPDLDPEHIRSLMQVMQTRAPAVFIFQTGVGTRALFAATDTLGMTDSLLRILDAAQVVVRGPKPTAALRARKVRIDLAARDPFTTHEVLTELRDMVLRGKQVVVQRYGETNAELQAALAARGADVIEIATYRWGLPADIGPLLHLIAALSRGEVDLVAFTSASQAGNLFAVARDHGSEAMLRQALADTLVASIGPVCSAALRKLAVKVDVEAQPPKLGPFITAIHEALTPEAT
jgi:uroporphyrinogen-III synthase